MTGAVTAMQVGSSPRCRSCHAPIWFGLTAKGRRMPLDPAPVEDGNVVIDEVELALRKLALVLPKHGPKDEPMPPPVRVLHKGDVVDPDVPRYVSHFATCAFSDRHRRPKARATT